MPSFRHIASALLAALVSNAVPLMPAAAQDADTNEVQRYTLTDAGLAKYAQATKKLAALPNRAGDCDDDAGDSQSINDMVAKLKAAPGAEAALQAAGMTPREYVVFSMSLLQNGLAAWAVKQPGGSLPPGVSKANVDFVNRHEAELTKLQGLAPRSDCDDGSGEDDSE